MSRPVDLGRRLTVAQASRRTPFSEAQLRAKIARGQIEVVRVGGRIFLLEEELARKLGYLYQPSMPRKADKRKALPKSLLHGGGRALLRRQAGPEAGR